MTKASVTFGPFTIEAMLPDWSPAHVSRFAAMASS